MRASLLALLATLSVARGGITADEIASAVRERKLVKLYAPIGGMTPAELQRFVLRRKRSRRTHRGKR
jgi:hypothetical protein